MGSGALTLRLFVSLILFFIIPSHTLVSIVYAGKWWPLPLAFNDPRLTRKRFCSDSITNASHFRKPNCVNRPASRVRGHHFRTTQQHYWVSNDIEIWIMYFERLKKALWILKTSSSWRKKGRTSCCQMSAPITHLSLSPSFRCHQIAARLLISSDESFMRNFAIFADYLETTHSKTCEITVINGERLSCLGLGSFMRRCHE